MEDIPARQKEIARRIADLEMEIRTWGSHNSQSNPGAVMELRATRKELAAAYKEFHALIVLAASMRSVEQRKPGDP